MLGYKWVGLISNRSRSVGKPYYDKSDSSGPVGRIYFLAPLTPKVFFFFFGCLFGNQPRGKMNFVCAALA